VLLGSANDRPVIATGEAISFNHAEDELREFVELTNIPVITRRTSRGAVPEDHPLSLGGGYYGFGAVRWAAPQADVVLAVGTRLTWQQMRPGTALKTSQVLIHLDSDPEVIGVNFPAEVALIADAKAGLKALLRAL
jgi:acetolactate synthase-1/2/3 large subunit